MLQSEVKLVYTVPQAWLSFQSIFSFFHHPGSSWGFLSCRLYFLVFSWLSYLLPKTGYTFIGFTLLCFQTTTSRPFRGLFSIGWKTKQLSCFPFKFALFNNHNNNNKNNNIFSFTKFSKLYNLTSRNYNPKFKLHAV